MTDMRIIMLLLLIWLAQIAELFYLISAIHDIKYEIHNVFSQNVMINHSLDKLVGDEDDDQPIPKDKQQRQNTGYWRDEGEPDEDDNIHRTCSNCGATDLQASNLEVPYYWRCGV